MNQTYNKEVKYVNILILLLIIVMFAIAYLSPQKKIYAIETEVNTTLKELNNYLKTGINSVYSLSQMTSSLMQLEDKLEIDEVKNIHSINNKNEFALDTAGLPNITGHGDFNPSKEVLTDMQMSLTLHEHFKMEKKLNQDYEWIYYISKHNFLTMYPYTPSSKYIWHKENILKPVWQYALPQNNPKKELFITPLYLDGAGKGLMVTMGKPIYKGDTFRGTLDIDITVKTLSQFLDRHNQNDGVYVLVNDKEQIVAASGVDAFKTDKIFNFSDLIFPEVSHVKHEKSSIFELSSHYTYVDGVDHTSWKLYYYKDKISMYLYTFLYLIFIFYILRLLFKLKRIMRSLETSHKKLEILAAIDPMTELYNKRSFDELSLQIFKKSQKNNLDFSLIILDIDNFKSINDTYGHPVGDIVIVHIAQLLKELLRKNDIICRYGGEEFIVLLPETTVDNSINIAQELCESIALSEVIIGDDMRISYTASLGVSCFNSDVDNEVLDVISRADKALYNAKNMGKNRVEAL
jgi:diguanylate cyclase (GGDEF)-like protein